MRHAARVSLSGVLPHQFRCKLVDQHLRIRKGRIVYVTYYDFDGPLVREENQVERALRIFFFI